jgi:hypothetical protein
MWQPKRLTPITEGPAEESFYERSSKDFVLHRPIGYKKSTSIVYERNTQIPQKDYKPYILQSCHKTDWTVPRARLVDLARESAFFVPTRFIFFRDDDICVGSQIADISLADVIHGSIPMTENHASAILTQVS